jgi:Ser/Thr protein kinase RdoA (MazF antagonist)
MMHEPSPTQFYSLTPEKVISALRSLGLSPSGYCFALNSYENRVFDFGMEDGTHLVGKFYRPGRWTAEQILDEHHYLSALEEEGLPVDAPYVFENGSSLQALDGIPFALWRKIPGRAPQEMDASELKSLGILLAQFHNFSSRFSLEHRPCLDGNSMGLQPLDFLISHGFVPKAQISHYEDMIYQAVDQFDKYSQGIPFHAIHGDFHLGNLLMEKGQFAILDFDDCRNGPAVQDIWMLVPGETPEECEKRKILLDAYSLFRDFDSDWFRLVKPLRALRCVHFSAWIAKRWMDPVFPKTFPHFGTPRYWDEEIDYLLKQLQE